MSAQVLLIDPKYDYNVGGAQRACAIFGATQLGWTGTRVRGPDVGARLPREERLHDYAHVRLSPGVTGAQWFLETRASWGIVPVAVEVRDAAESLVDFEHPEKAVYVFGPEDGTLGRAGLGHCHRFIRIPSEIRSPLNLSMAVNVVLYDRYAKAIRR